MISFICDARNLSVVMAAAVVPAADREEDGLEPSPSRDGNILELVRVVAAQSRV